MQFSNLNKNVCWLIVACFMATFGSLSATHNRAGEITYRQIGPLTIEVTITTYTKSSSVAADRDSLEFFWGDNTKNFIRRDNNRTRFEANDVKVNYYVGRHTFPGPATYTMYLTDPNRIGSILNINYPNSIDIPFFLSTTFTLLNQQFQGPNNSVVLLQPPLDVACVGKRFTHNPNAFDPDGDSLRYELTTPLQAMSTPVPGYKFPDQIVTGPDNQISINPVTGEVIWDSPKVQGEYNIAIRILEYRQGKLINVVLRDMQILVRDCENNPPIIVAPDEVCIIAGEKLDLKIKILDSDPGQLVGIFATGGPLQFAQPAIFEAPGQFTSAPANARIIWQTNCSHIAPNYYQIVVRAIDNFFGDSSGLATLKTIRIKVVGPPPENLKAESKQNSVKLLWESPYLCAQQKPESFLGFSVWRRSRSLELMQDTCQPGLTGKGYTKIAVGIKSIDAGSYLYEDLNVNKGQTYCYRVLPEFALLNDAGVPYAKIEGMHSEEICTQVSRILPLWTRISVSGTDAADGTMEVRWTKPLLNEVDSVLFPPPYLFKFFRKKGTGQFEELSQRELLVNNLSTLKDTTFEDTSLETSTFPYTYKINFLSQGKEVGTNADASSIYLNAEPTDQKMKLSWSFDVPWSNTLFDIFRKNENATFEKIGQTTLLSFLDENLDNGKEYCYYVRATGTYGLNNIEDPLINLSQEACDTPLDNVPPCNPELQLKNICDKLSVNSPVEDLINELNWQDVSKSCPELASDLKSYKIYYSPDKSGPFEFIDEVPGNQLNYFHKPGKGLAGCYQVTSTDTSGNENIATQFKCIENCPLYILPNTFTPNGDGHNELFVPRANFFVEKIDFKVFNQWGNKVFETEDPQINWDGQNFQKEPLADGVYHYICILFVENLENELREYKVLSGFVQIIRK